MPDGSTRTVIVALPDSAPADWAHVASVMSWHSHPACVPHAAFLVRRRPILSWISRWSPRHLIYPVRRHGSITHAAGGRLGRLDLQRLTYAAHLAAAAQWHTWNTYIAATTPPARTWDAFQAEQRAQKNTTLEEARKKFDAQPRVLAMLAYSSYPAAPFTFDPDDLDAYQAGEAVYVALHWQHVVTGDALITPDGHFLEPESTSLADRLNYLTEAGHVIASLTSRHRLIAVRAAPAP